MTIQSSVCKLVASALTKRGEDEDGSQLVRSPRNSAMQRYNRFMAILDAGLLDSEATAVYAHLFDALGDPTRLAVLQHLASGEHRVRDLVEHLGLAQSTVSKHLRFLQDCRLITVRTEGRASWFDLAQPSATAALINAAEVLLHDAGTHASLCSHLHQLSAVPIARKGAA